MSLGGNLGRSARRWISIGLATIIGSLLLLSGLAVADVRDEGSQETRLDLGAAHSSAPATTVAPVTTVPPAPPVVDDRELIIFLQPIATSAQIDAVRQSLKRMTDVRSVRFVNKAQALEEIRVMFADHPDVLKAITLADAPVNFHVVPQMHADRQLIGARLAGYKGVLRVVYPGQ